jgi:hypothetical protein
MESTNETTQRAGALGEKPRVDPDQSRALLALLELGRKEIAAGNFVPASEVFAELEKMDEEAGFI